MTSGEGIGPMELHERSLEPAPAAHRRQRVFGEERTCIVVGCGTRLSRYNPNERCGAHAYTSTGMTVSNPHEEMTLHELHELARERGLPGRSRMNKAELIGALWKT